jgi:hypothetical protein
MKSLSRRARIALCSTLQHSPPEKKNMSHGRCSVGLPRQGDIIDLPVAGGLLLIGYGGLRVGRAEQLRAMKW